MEKESSKANELPKLAVSALISRYVEYLNDKKQLARNSVLAYQRDLQQFNVWIEEQELDCLAVDQRHIMQFLLYKMQLGTKASSSARIISSLKSFYGFLQVSQFISQNPCVAIKPPVIEKGGSVVMTFDQVEQLLQSPDLNLLIGIRDRAMLELLYATGVSISELINIKCQDVDLNRSSLTIASEGAKFREIPLISSAISHIKRY